MTEGTGGLGLTPTPDTGERLTEVRVWDEATRPTGPAPPPGTVYSARGRLIASVRLELAQPAFPGQSPRGPGEGLLAVGISHVPPLFSDARAYFGYVYVYSELSSRYIDVSD